MDKIEKALETFATIDANRQLILDTSLPIAGPKKVRVIILIPEETDIDESEWLKSVNKNPSFQFLKEPEEDIYSLADGKSYSDQR